MLRAYGTFLVEVGVYGNVFLLPCKTAGYLTTDGTWFKNLCGFVEVLDIKVIFPAKMHFQTVREND